MDNTNEIRDLMSSELNTPIPDKIDSIDKLKEFLSVKFNDLIITDFNRLIHLLYRIDIDEKKLKQLLKDNEGKDAGELLADLTIERQIQKIRSRQQSGKRDDNISDDEKW